jgi:galactonate dehydratase
MFTRAVPNAESQTDDERSPAAPRRSPPAAGVPGGGSAVLEKAVVTAAGPVPCGGISEVRIIAEVEAYYASVAPHNPSGPISLATVQIARRSLLIQAGIAGRGCASSRSGARVPGTPTRQAGCRVDETRWPTSGHDWTNPQSYDAD